MSANVLAVLKKVQLFEGLKGDDLAEIGNICRVGKVQKGQVVFSEDSEGDQIYIILEGSIEIQIMARGSDGQPRQTTINTLYSGQSFGEMALLGGGGRSASAVAASAATLLVISGPDFDALCEQNARIGYRVFRNLSNDLVYKLRSSALLLRGTIKWQDNQLSQL
jgi:CRP/FNR family transcriptional regulator, cyclic AMP receptor protein